MKAFYREAQAVLREGGYAFERMNGRGHAVWTHPDVTRPDINLPSSPRNEGNALQIVRRAVRKGIVYRQGEAPVMPPARSTSKINPPLAEKLVQHAPAHLKKHASDPSVVVTKDDVATWLRRCIQNHAPIPGSQMRLAMVDLKLQSHHLTIARNSLGAVAYQIKGEGGPKGETYTDFAAKVPENGMLMGGRGTSRKVEPVKRYRETTPEPLETAVAPQGDALVIGKTGEPLLHASGLPVGYSGRPLENGDLTEEQRQKAMRQMQDSTDKANAEIAALRNGAGPTGETTRPASPEISAALEMLLEAALASTHRLTDEHVAMLRSYDAALEGAEGTIRGVRRGLAKMLDAVTGVAEPVQETVAA